VVEALQEFERLVEEIIEKNNNGNMISGGHLSKGQREIVLVKGLATNLGAYNIGKCN